MTVLLCYDISIDPNGSISGYCITENVEHLSYEFLMAKAKELEDEAKSRNQHLRIGSLVWKSVNKLDEQPKK